MKRKYIKEREEGKQKVKQDPTQGYQKNTPTKELKMKILSL